MLSSQTGQEPRLPQQIQVQAAEIVVPELISYHLFLFCDFELRGEQPNIPPFGFRLNAAGRIEMKGHGR